MIMKTVIPHPTPSLNETLREHWATTRKRKHMQESYIGVAFLASTKASERDELRRKFKTVKIHVHHHGPMRDVDNLIGGCKTLLDALKTCGVIVDDKRENMVAEYSESIGKKPYYTMVKVS